MAWSVRGQDSTAAYVHRPIDVVTGGLDNRGDMPVDSDTVPVGAQAPEFTLQAANDGRDVSLSDYRGRAVVLVFLRGFG